ncbi:serine/threonine-protein kinase [Streptosporangium sp. NBC_01756]|uniref:serine/threonine-protein kinase n=1 Tax=Streptosporangium sp. NBC_01756 TaxID=2975950 RepID=UPI002DD95568|nr:serine/threonine-protein kinase [Streptosporangium sp. NBC_01756]WSC83867.1 serine/threonine protein kinase [Streptosporangium sp. NBC_01756]
MNPSEQVTPGDSPVIGGYTLRRVLGRGGMGTVHLATTPAGALAAVKVINPELARDPAFQRRFEREVAAARLVARFCTAPVLDAGFDGDVAYLVTEYVKGPDLAHAVREQGPMAGSDLEALAVGIAVALNAIHGAGVVHRDLKPSNVLLSPLGPRVIDFGIAKLVEGDSLATQAILGTPAFMAPEQVRGEPITPAADVYAWGGVVVFAGTGRLPFGGGAPAEVLYRIVNEGPHLDGLDGRMRGFVERAMAKDPASRPSARELLGELVGGPDATPATAVRVVERTWTGQPPAEADPTRAQGMGEQSAPDRSHGTSGQPAPSWSPGPPGPGDRPEQGWPQNLPGQGDRPEQGWSPGPSGPPGRPGPGWPQNLPEYSGTGIAGQDRTDMTGGRPPGPPPYTAVGSGTLPVGAGGPGLGPPPDGAGTAGRDRPAAPRGRRRRRLFAGLAALTVAVGAATWWAVARPGEEWPFHADFGAADHSWSVGATEAGRAETADGAYVLTVKPGWRLWKSAPGPAEPESGVVISGAARLTEGSGEFGVWCRGDAGTGDRYEFGVDDAGTVSITKRQAGQQGVVLYGPVENTNIKKSADNRIVAECRPDGTKLALRMWVNDAFAGEAVDDAPHAPGLTGLYAAPDGDAELRVRFGSFDLRPAGG